MKKRFFAGVRTAYCGVRADAGWRMRFLSLRYGGLGWGLIGGLRYFLLFGLVDKHL